MPLAARQSIILRHAMNALLLLPLDGTTKDEWALPIAAAFADLTAADVRMIRVVDSSAEVTRDLEQMLARQVEQFTSTGHSASFSIAVSDDVPGELLRFADEKDVTLVVMATRAPGLLDRTIRGSVADRLVRESRRPIVVAPPGTNHIQGKLPNLRRALVPLDGSHAALETIELLLSWPLAAELELVLLRVVEPLATHAKAKRAQRALQSIADQARPRCAGVETRVAKANEPSTVIADAVRQEFVDFIAMTTHGAGGVERLLIGSVAEQVVRAAEIPVLVMTAADRAVPR
jgi:nucleotide-binding universal stress UspA family protein